MQSFQLLENLKFHEKSPNAEPLHVDANGRALRFTMEPGQAIREHEVPSSPFFVVILQGKGIFSGEDGREQTYGPETMLVFDPGEKHTVRALEKLVFMGFLHGAPGAQVSVESGSANHSAR